MMFSDKLILWYEENGRSLPWRSTQNPYYIWLSEIILQQTRIEQGMSYYHRFVETFPTVNDLAAASEQEVLKLWQGLGYYSRARNLHKAARYIVDKLDGIFPTSYELILSLPGVGKYTAAAIASFAFQLPHPVIDGNVYRFISRLYGIDIPIGTDQAFRFFEAKLIQLIDTKRSGQFNQALMDFGSLYCKPVNPDCDHCVFYQECVARRQRRVEFLPIKKSKTQVRDRWFYYFVLEWLDGDKEMTLMHCREKGDIWQGLYEFPLLEKQQRINEKELSKESNSFLEQFGLKMLRNVDIVALAPHKLSHQTIHATFISLKIDSKVPKNTEKYAPIEWEKIKSLPVSRLIDRYLSQL